MTGLLEPGSASADVGGYDALFAGLVAIAPFVVLLVAVIVV